jgi:hypothetical protein
VRQDRRREPDAVGSVRLAIAYTRLADGDRTDTGHHLAFRQVTVAHDALVAVRSLQIGMLAEKVRDLGFDRLGQQSTHPCGCRKSNPNILVVQPAQDRAAKNGPG